MKTQGIGTLAERQAERFLKQHGYLVLKKNYSTRMGEIDLILQKSDLLVFVEVRMRSNKRYGTGADTVTKTKQKKLIRTAEHYLQRHPNFGNTSMRFDVVSIDADGEIDWIPGAFTLD